MTNPDEVQDVFALFTENELMEYRRLVEAIASNKRYEILDGHLGGLTASAKLDAIDKALGRYACPVAPASENIYKEPQTEWRRDIFRGGGRD